MNMIPLWLGSPKKPTAGRPAREPRSQGSPAPFDYLGGLPVCIWEFCETSSYFCSYSSMARSPVHSVRSLQVVMPLLLVAICCYLLEKNILEKKKYPKDLVPTSVPEVVSVARKTAGIPRSVEWSWMLHPQKKPTAAGRRGHCQPGSANMGWIFRSWLRPEFVGDQKESALVLEILQTSKLQTWWNSLDGTPKNSLDSLLGIGFGKYTKMQF